MTETNDPTTAASGDGGKKRGGGLSTMLLADLKSMAGGLGVPGAGSMKKAQLVDAIKSVQSGPPAAASAAAPPAAAAEAPEAARTPVRTRTRREKAPVAELPLDVPAAAPVAEKPARAPRVTERATQQQPEQAPDTQVPSTPAPTQDAPAQDAAPVDVPVVRSRTRRRAAQVAPVEETPEQAPDQAREQPERRTDPERHDGQVAASRGRSRDQQAVSQEKAQDKAPAANQGGRTERAERGERNQTGRAAQNERNAQNDRAAQNEKAQSDRAQNEKAQNDRAQNDRERAQNDRAAQNERNAQADREAQTDRDAGDDGTGRNRRRRGRDRERNRPLGTTNGQREPDITVLEDDVLVPAAGILDVLDNYAFVRTSGYLPGDDDVYVSLSMVRRFGLRRGDALVGQVRQPREGERKEKFNPMVSIDTVNGADPEASKNRVEFAKLTPLHPSERLRLETGPTNLIGRIIDIAAPIGKGQRGLIVSPEKSGKTTILQSIAQSITTNNPECHLMVVLLDERPEEVTDFGRSVNGEVISSTFDRPPADHTLVAELAIERAKRLVELGHDVVVLLDGITRLGRAYHLSLPPSGRMLAGGVDAAALHPPQRFFGAARNVENGGSLTILATATVESGSKTDELIFEEFRGTANMELRLRRDLADKRLFPAIDAVQSGTRHEELLMGAEEVAILWKLRRVLTALEGQQAIELLLGRLGKSQTNIEFLMQVQKATPTQELGVAPQR